MKDNNEIIKVENQSNNSIMLDISLDDDSIGAQIVTRFKQVYGRDPNLNNRKDCKVLKRLRPEVTLDRIHTMSKKMLDNQENKKKLNLWDRFKQYIVIGIMLVILFTITTYLNETFGWNLPTDAKTLIDIISFGILF